MVASPQHETCQITKFPPKRRRQWLLSVKIILWVNLVLGLLSAGVAVRVYWRVCRFETALRELERFDVVAPPIVNIPKWIPDWARWNWVQLYYTEIQRIVLLSDPAQNQQFSDDSLRIIAQIPGIESLTLSYTQVTDHGLAELDGVANLKTIWLNGTNITDLGVRSLEKHNRLENLSLVDTQITGASLKTAGSFPNLRRLHLGICPVTDEEIQSIQSLPLRYLDVRSPLLTDEGFAVIAQLPELIWLCVDATQISPQAFDSLATKNVLGKITISSARSIDDYAGPISTIASLNFVGFRGGRLGARGAEELRRLPGLSWLELEQVHLSAGVVEHIGLQKGLQSLTLRETNLTDTDLQSLLPLAGQLTRLSLENTDLTDAGLAALKEFTAIEELILTGDRFSSVGVAHLESMTWLTSLTIESERLTDECIPSLAKLTGLRSLDLRKTSLTKTGANTLKTSLPTTSVSPPP